jgi:DNA-binding MarR family transcriptional regulator
MTGPQAPKRSAAPAAAPPDGLDPGPLAGEPGLPLHQLRNLLTRRVLAAYAPFGLPSGAFSVMALIAANPGCPQNRLSRELGLDKSVLRAILDDLEGRGLAARGRAAADRRRHALALTPEGLKVMGRMHLAACSVEQPLREALSQDELDLLSALLQRAFAAMTRSEG